jgi:hypothetical protein
MAEFRLALSVFNFPGAIRPTQFLFTVEETPDNSGIARNEQQSSLKPMHQTDGLEGRRGAPDETKVRTGY